MRSTDCDHNVYIGVEWFESFNVRTQKNRWARVQTYIRNRYTFRGEVKNSC